MTLDTPAKSMLSYSHPFIRKYKEIIMNWLLKLVAAIASAVGLLAGGAIVAGPAANAATACSANRVLVDDRG